MAAIQSETFWKMIENTEKLAYYEIRFRSDHSRDTLFKNYYFKKYPKGLNGPYI